MRFGFSLEAPDVLASVLVHHAMANLPVQNVQMERGPPRSIFEGIVPAPDGRLMPLRTVWLRPQNPPEMRFVTAVPLTR